MEKSKKDKTLNDQVEENWAMWKKSKGLLPKYFNREGGEAAMRHLCESLTEFSFWLGCEGFVDHIMASRVTSALEI